MSAHYCPYCGLFEVSADKPGKDGRCDWCRSQIGRSPDDDSPRQGHQESSTRLSRTP